MVNVVLAATHSNAVTTRRVKGPEARDGERSFGRHHSNSFTTPDTKRTKGQGPGMVNVLVAATHGNAFAPGG